MIDVEAAAQKDAELRKQIRRVNILLIAIFLIVLAIPLFVTWWVGRAYPSISTIEIENVQVIGPTDLCPGEVLTFAYDFHASGSGVLIRDATARYVEPPKTVIFSNSRRFIQDGPIDEHVIEAWHVPATYLDPETDEAAPVPVGRYYRHFAVSSPSRSTVIAIATVPFTVKPQAECVP